LNLHGSKTLPYIRNSVIKFNKGVTSVQIVLPRSLQLYDTILLIICQYYIYCLLIFGCWL